MNEHQPEASSGDLNTDALKTRMKSDWELRARTDHRYYIASGVPQNEEAFIASGAYDAELFFGGIEHLLTQSTDAIDIGCGAGRMDRVIASRLRSLVGIDVSAEMVRLARINLAGVPNAS